MKEKVLLNAICYSKYVRWTVPDVSIHERFGCKTELFSGNPLHHYVIIQTWLNFSRNVKGKVAYSSRITLFAVGFRMLCFELNNGWLTSDITREFCRFMMFRSWENQIIKAKPYASYFLLFYDIFYFYVTVIFILQLFLQLFLRYWTLAKFLNKYERIN